MGVGLLVINSLKWGSGKKMKSCSLPAVEVCYVIVLLIYDAPHLQCLVVKLDLFEYMFPKDGQGYAKMEKTEIISTLKENLLLVKQKTGEGKKLLHSYVTSDASFEDRVAVWLAAPDAFKEHSDWIYHFNEPFENFFNENNNRYETIDLTYYFGEFFKKDGVIFEEALHDYFDICDKDKFMEDFKRMAEDVLSANLGSYKFDW